MKIFMLLLALLIAEISATDTITGCSGTCTCDADEDCIVNCVSGDTCKDATINCNGATTCTVNCGVKDSCSGNTAINADDTSELSVTCSAEDACKGNTIIDCGESICSVACTTSSTSCEDTTVDASSAASFTCTGSYCGDLSDVTTAPATTTTAPGTTDAGTTTTDATTTTAAPGDDEDDDSSDSSSSDEAAAAHLIGDRFQDNSDANSGYTEQIVISFSKNAMINIWALVIGFLVVNVVIAWCYCFRSKKNTKVTFEDDIGSKI